MKKVSIFLIIISLFATNIKAQQQSDIQQIRNWYNSTKEKIAFSKKNKYESSLYCDIMERNVHGASWRAVGNYHSKTQFWYHEDPNLSDNECENKLDCLKIIIDKTESSVNNYYSEYLYHKGQLVFVFYKKNDEQLRLYFKNKKLIKKLGKIKEFAPTVEDMQKQSENYMITFLASFGLSSN